MAAVAAVNGARTSAFKPKIREKNALVRLQTRTPLRNLHEAINSTDPTPRLLMVQKAQMSLHPLNPVASEKQIIVRRCMRKHHRPRLRRDRKNNHLRKKGRI